MNSSNHTFIKQTAKPQFYFKANTLKPKSIIIGCKPLTLKIVNCDMSHKVRKRTFGHVRPAKTQISLHIHAFLSEFSLRAFWIAKDTKLLCADNDDSDHTLWMRKPS